MIQAEVEKIYLENMRNVKNRISYAENQIESFNKSNDYYILENTILHLRKTLECIAYASIAPNKEAYAKVRLQSEQKSDFRKDYHAGKIIKQLAKINPDFYPLPLIEPKLVADRQWYFDRLDSGYLTQEEYIKLYDKLGKFLHSDNPWDNKKEYANLAKDIGKNFQKIKLLLQIHATFVQDKKVRYSFVIDMGSTVKDVSIIAAMADTPFSVYR